MKKVLITGASGFIGRNIAPILRKKYDIACPCRSELNLLDPHAVHDYLDTGSFDAVVHLANPTSQNPIDLKSELFERSMRVFATLEACAGMYGRMIYLGSGAEYGKHREISRISEEEFGTQLPWDAYGLSRYLMSKLAENHNNIINLRLFACCGLGDPPYKLIPHIIACVRGGKEIQLNQDVWFDFLYAEDIAAVLSYFLENRGNYRAYNLCSGQRVLISNIALEVRRQMGSNCPIVFKKDGLGLEYTASNKRLLQEIPDWRPRPIAEAVRRILENENWKA